MEAVSEALKKARYGEAVVVQVSSDTSESLTTELVFVASLDEENGGIVWNNVASEQEEDVGIVRHLRTKKWVLPMLNDKRRNKLYDTAIREACREAIRRQEDKNDKHIRVLDIGSGTGLLAMMAAKYTKEGIAAEQQAKTKVKVTSVEMASAMARLAASTIRANNMDTDINVVEGHSGELKTNDKFHICTSELLESGLLGEGMLPALRDAWDRHLYPDAVVVPQRARVFCQVVEGKDCIARYRGPSLSQRCPIRMQTSTNSQDVLLGCETSTGPSEGITFPIHARALLRGAPQLNNDKISTARVLCDPVAVLDFDFSCKESIPPPEGRCVSSTPVATAAGTAHGVLFWWELDLWDGATYSTKTGKEPWQDHWLQCLYVFPESQCPTLKQGQRFELLTRHSDLCIHFKVNEIHKEEVLPAKRPRTGLPLEWATINRHISPERAYQLNDENRINVFRDAISFALSEKGLDAPILDLSDFSLCVILAALLGATRVNSLESSSGGIPELSARVAQLANGLPRSPSALFQVLNCHAENLTLDLLATPPVQIVMAEPYYEILEGWHLQEALNYCYLLKSLRRSGVISADFISVPAYAKVMGCGIQCKALQEAYQGCGDAANGVPTVRGFDHDLVNKLGNRYHLHDACFPMWQYDHLELTERFELARICYNDDCRVEGNGTWKRGKFTRPGSCHALMCWIEYGLRCSGGDDSAGDDCCKYLSTLSRSHRQSIRLLSVPFDVSSQTVTTAFFRCKATLGGLIGPEDHDFEVCVDYLPSSHEYSSLERSVDEFPSNEMPLRAKQYPLSHRLPFAQNP